MISSSPSRSLPAGACITGVILAGGQGRRMSATGAAEDKALVAYRGRPLAAWVIERLSGQVAELLLNANRSQAAHARFGLPVVSDRIAGFAGPLAGVHAAMCVARHPWVLSAPCDAPLLPRDLAARLCAGIAATGAALAVAHAAGREQPTFLLVHRSLTTDLERYLRSGAARASGWCASVHHARVEFDDATAFRNMNTRADLVEDCDD